MNDFCINDPSMDNILRWIQILVVETRRRMDMTAIVEDSIHNNNVNIPSCYHTYVLRIESQ